VTAAGVTREGLEGIRPGREATVGVNAGPRERRRRRGGRGEQPMVPEAEFQSYYGLPILNGPVWHSPEIPGYLFLGGLAGASSLMAAGAQATGRAHLARASKVTALGAITLSTAALVKDLGRPDRFYNMLRVFKPTSPMSVGSWILAAYGPAAGAAAATSVLGRFRRVGVAATVGAAVLGPAVATYTAALVCDTAVPAWHDGYREMPFVFAGSSATAAAGAALVLAPVSETAPARRVALVGSLTEALAAKRLEGRLGFVAEPYHQGSSGRRMRLGQALTAGGVVLSLLGRRNRALSALAGAALVGASAVTRFGIFEAGKQSAADPRYTVEPQRRRLERADQPASRTTNSS
jgi:hypothetical protein